MNPQSIKNEIISVLQADSDLSALPVRNVYEGYRTGLPNGNFPCIMIELVENEEVRNDGNDSIDLVLTLSIGAFLKVENKDSQLDDILDFEKLIKKALSQDVKLNGQAIKFDFDTTIYDVELWPIRGAIIKGQALYRQSFTTRT